MTNDENLGVEPGLDELEPAKELMAASPDEPVMTPPVDRKTPREPDPPITASQAIELIVAIVAPMKSQVNTMHEMIVGVKLPDGTPKGGIGKDIHDVHNSAIILTEATAVIEDAFMEAATSPNAKRKTLPQLIAESVANQFIAIWQVEVRAMTARIEALEAAEQRRRLNGDAPEGS